MPRVSQRRRTLAYPLSVLWLVLVIGGPASGSEVTGSAGTETALAATESAVTVAGRGLYAGLRISVNQTKNLLNQAVSVTWTGGTPTVDGIATFASDYLQIMQCWGDDDGTNAANPGPPPEKCAFGATNSVYGGIAGSPFPPGSLATERIISREGWENFNPSLGSFDPKTGSVWRDFVAVDGTRIGNHIDSAFNPSAEGGVYWQNPFFNIVTSNEIAGARTLENGTGSEFFEVVTGVENGGLGCGQKVEGASGARRVPRCWLVVVPRGEGGAENAGTPFGPSSGVVTSPLAPDRWKHRIAVPLEFNPVDTACALGDESRRLVGNELVLGAVASWQPVLCATPGLRPYSYGIVSDAGARQQLVVDAPGSAGMYVVSRPLAKELEDPSNRTVYAPLTLSGLTIGFNIERVPGLEAGPGARRLKSVRIATLNLTPRLVAKLLTQSYTRQVNIKRLPGYEWIKGNPDHMGKDPDFLRFNQEFNELEVVWRKQFSGLLLPAGNSDAAQQLWGYVLADAEAKAWLDGTPDEWGMRVNPVYSTVASANSQGIAFAEEPPNSLPKSDPYCYQGPQLPSGVTPPLLCGTDWYPYTQSMRDAARLARAADDGARLDENSFATSPDKVYGRTPPQPPGGRTIMALTDTASARLFGLQPARLSRSGDNGSDRRFIAPDAAGLTAGVAAMAPREQPAVLEPVPTAAAPDAYPLTVLAYGALRPLQLDGEERREYAAFVEYAAGPGQSSGLRHGELPAGYAPLPPALATQSKMAAKSIRELASVPVIEAADLIAATTPDRPVASARVATSPSAPTSRRRSSARLDPATAAPPTSATPREVEREPAGGHAAVGPMARTPLVAVPVTGFAVPGLAAITLLAALGALEITKRPRRAVLTAPRPED